MRLNSTPPHPPHLHSFPTRRSSDLDAVQRRGGIQGDARLDSFLLDRLDRAVQVRTGFDMDCEIGRARFGELDRKSTRLNSSHRTISYAVFCLKKKRGMRLRAWGGVR